MICRTREKQQHSSIILYPNAPPNDAALQSLAEARARLLAAPEYIAFVELMEQVRTLSMNPVPSLDFLPAQLESTWKRSVGNNKYSKNVTFDELPDFLTATDIARYLGIAKANAYALLNQEGFPRIRLTQKRIGVPKFAFARWLEENVITTSREA